MAEVVQLVEKTAGKEEDGAEDEDSILSAPPRTISVSYTHLTLPTNREV